MSLPKINIQIVSDVMCPWCWVGKRKLEQAIAATSDRFQFHVRWEPFLLRPGMPPEGVAKAPETPDNPRVGHHLKAAGNSVGINFTGKCPVTPNTLPAHALLDYSKEVDGGSKQNDLMEAIFNMYFTVGLVPDVNTLLAIAEKFELDTKEAKRVMTDQNNLDRIHEIARNWSRQGVSGVPTFYMNGYRTFSGGQEVETFIKTFEAVIAKSKQ